MQQVTVLTSSNHTSEAYRARCVGNGSRFLVTTVFLVLRWPLSREAVLNELEDESQSRVNIGGFHGTYFPRPGCVLEHVTFQHNPGRHRSLPFKS